MLVKIKGMTKTDAKLSETAQAFFDFATSADASDFISTGRGQFLAVLAGILGAGNGFKAVPRSAASLPANEDYGRVAAACILPVGDLAGVELGDGFHVQVGHGVVRVNDDGDAVIGQDGGRQAAGCFLILQIAAAEANVTAALLDSLPRIHYKSNGNRSYLS